MRKLLRNIIKILDGTPAEHGRAERGQSLVELVFMTPVLILLLVGLAEIGWFANNYLILLEVSRVGARFGTVQEGENTPIAWERRTETYTANVPGTTAGANLRDCDTTIIGFYELLACVMIQSFDPLELDTTGTSVDDIVISVFSTNRIGYCSLVDEDCNGTAEGTAQEEALAALLVQPITRPENRSYTGDTDYEWVISDQVVVTGRYPANANECGLLDTDDATAGIQPERDPFDFFANDTVDPWELDQTRRDIRTEASEASPGELSTLYDGNAENLRGWSFLGNHNIVDAPGCLGSEWSVNRMEDLLNLPSIGLSAEVRVNLPPSQGVVLVEVFWQHDLLLDLPAFAPVFNTISGGGSNINVWAIFPVPSVEFRFDSSQDL